MACPSAPRSSPRRSGTAPPSPSPPPGTPPPAASPRPRSSPAGNRRVQAFLSALRRQLGPQNPAEQLAGLVVGQLRAEGDDARRAGGTEAGSDPVLQLFGTGRRAGLQHNGGGHGLAPLVVGEADDAGLGHRRVGDERGFDL